MDLHRRAIDRVREAIRRRDSGEAAEPAGPERKGSEAADPAVLQRTRGAMREHDESVRREQTP